MLLRVAQVQGVDDHADVGAVLAAHLALRDVDQLDPLGVEFADRVVVMAPVAIGPLVDDAALFQQPFEDQLDLELARLHVANADGQILEIDEHGDQRFVGTRQRVFHAHRLALPAGTLKRWQEYGKPALAARHLAAEVGRLLLTDIRSENQPSIDRIAKSASVMDQLLHWPSSRNRINPSEVTEVVSDCAVKSSETEVQEGPEPSATPFEGIVCKLSLLGTGLCAVDTR